MKFCYTLFVLCLFLLSACNSDQKTVEITSLEVPVTKPAKSKKKKAVSSPNDFSDLEKKDDESCETEEELQKKMEDELKKSKSGVPSSLEGGPDCAVQ